MMRASIAADVTARGWNATQRAFTSWCGAEDMDAAVLWVGLSGLIPADDERFVLTVEAVQRRLQTGALVYRYECDDGLPGREGAFLLCSAWLVDALLLLGRTREAERLFDEYRRSAGATGCIPEEYDPDRGVGLGNHPQAYSHLGLILNALNLDRALHPDGRSGRVAAR
jgi:GH15 family glucan-1,4-alpha-glucosidase